MLKMENMRPWEVVVSVIKRHWIVYVILSVFFLLAIFISFSIYLLLWFNFLSNMINIVFWQFFWVFLYIQWLNHDLDMYVVTNNRVVWIEQISFLNRTVTECNLWQVQEVNSQTSWLFANILNYGTLSIQTAWNQTTLKMDFCPDAMQQSRKLLNVVDEYRDKQNHKTEDK